MIMERNPTGGGRERSPWRVEMLPGVSDALEVGPVAKSVGFTRFRNRLAVFLASGICPMGS